MTRIPVGGQAFYQLRPTAKCFVVTSLFPLIAFLYQFRMSFLCFLVINSDICYEMYSGQQNVSSCPEVWKWHIWSYYWTPKRRTWCGTYAGIISICDCSVNWTAKLMLSSLLAIPWKTIILKALWVNVVWKQGAELDLLDARLSWNWVTNYIQSHPRST